MVAHVRVTWESILIDLGDDDVSGFDMEVSGECDQLDVEEDEDPSSVAKTIAELDDNQGEAEDEV